MSTRLGDYIERYGGYWAGEVPGYPVEDWEYEVQNGDTRLGYWEWARAMSGETRGNEGDNEKRIR